MNKTFGLAALIAMSAGCSSYTATLYPRGSGDVAVGVAGSDREMRVTLRGDEYVGRIVQASSTGVGLAARYGTPTTGVMASASNQYAATLVNGSRALRCEFMGDRGGGNGVCVDSAEKVYDLVLKPQ